MDGKFWGWEEPVAICSEPDLESRLLADRLLLKEANDLGYLPVRLNDCLGPSQCPTWRLAPHFEQLLGSRVAVCQSAVGGSRRDRRGPGDDSGSQGGLELAHFADNSSLAAARKVNKSSQVIPVRKRRSKP